jgi:hypothetical protein
MELWTISSVKPRGDHVVFDAAEGTGQVDSGQIMGKWDFQNFL